MLQELSYLVQSLLKYQRAFELSEIIDFETKSLPKLLQCKFTSGHILCGIYLIQNLLDEVKGYYIVVIQLILMKKQLRMAD